MAEATQEFIKMGRRQIPKEELFASGHRACAGCAEALAVRLATKAIGPDTIIVNATGCMEVISSQLPTTSWRVPWIHTLFENTGAVASGVEAARRMMVKKHGVIDGKTHIVAMAGDGGTADIGLQSLSGMLERGHDILYIAYDNEAYMNTGIQRSSSTPFGASTTTSPAGKESIGQATRKKNLPEIAAAHEIPYVATACPSYPFDLMDKVKRGLEAKGPAYLHILSVCPTGWRCNPELAIKIGRLAVESGIFPLYEITNGVYNQTVTPANLKPVNEYLSLQGRFRHLSPENIAQIQERVNKDYAILQEKVRLTKDGIVI
jgi:pyruvate ferredoxin oxidoreductase beta subunit